MGQTSGGAGKTPRGRPNGRRRIRQAPASPPRWRWPYLTRLIVAGLGVLLGCTLISSATVYAVQQRNAHIAQARTARLKCKFLRVPCLGPINTMYDMDGLGGGDTKLLWATRPSQDTEVRVPSGNLQKQVFVCHTAPNVELVAVFVLAHSWEPTRGHVHSVTTREPIKPHSCEVTQRTCLDKNALLLVLTLRLIDRLDRESRDDS
jgi:hypothetical protein